MVRRRMRSTVANSSGPGLLRDDLAEQGAEQPDLDRERVAGAGRPDPERFGRDRRRRPGAHEPLIAAAVDGPYRAQAASGSQPSGPQPFSRLVS